MNILNARVFSPLALVLVLIGGCSSREDPDGQPEIFSRAPQNTCSQRSSGQEADSFISRDSAGITIAENWVPPFPGSIIRPSLTTTVAPDASDAAELSGRIVSTTRLANGGIVVADSLTSSLALFDSAGKFVQLLGRRGEGPGEYRGIRGVFHVTADTLAVVDLDYGRRMTRILANGRVVDARILPFQPLSSNERTNPYLLGHMRFVVGLMSGGSMLTYFRPQFSMLPPGKGNTKYYFDSLVVQRFEIENGRATGLAKLPNWVLFAHENEKGDVWMYPAPFSSRGRLVAGGAGFYYGWGERYEVTEYGTDGKVLKIIRVCLGRIAIDSQAMSRWRSSLRAKAKPQALASTREALEKVRVPTTGPAFVDLLVGRDGWLWIGEFHFDDDPQRWRIVSPTGRVVGFAETPPGVVLVELGATHVLGIRTDSDDLQTVVAYSWLQP